MEQACVSICKEKVDFKAPEKGPFEGPGRSIIKHQSQREAHLKGPREVAFKAPAWADFEALERAGFSGPSVSLGINLQRGGQF